MNLSKGKSGPRPDRERLPLGYEVATVTVGIGDVGFSAPKGDDKSIGKVRVHIDFSVSNNEVTVGKGTLIRDKKFNPLALKSDQATNSIDGPKSKSCPSGKCKSVSTEIVISDSEIEHVLSGEVEKGGKKIGGEIHLKAPASSITMLVNFLICPEPDDKYSIQNPSHTTSSFGRNEAKDVIEAAGYGVVYLRKIYFWLVRLSSGPDLKNFEKEDHYYDAPKEH